MMDYFNSNKYIIKIFDLFSEEINDILTNPFPFSFFNDNVNSG